MRGPTAAVEASLFGKAARAFLGGRPASSIQTMMELATGAGSDIIKRWASVWLFRNLGIAIAEQDEARPNATSPEAANLR